MTISKISRRKWLKSTAPLVAAVASPAVASSPTKPHIRLIVASDGHYGQPDTPFERNHQEFVRWINQEKFQKGLDFLILNGDLIHDEPTLLYDFKNAISPLQVPYYVVRGNHDKVGMDVWKSTWGYETNHSFTRGEFAFILADTSNERGEYVCPNLDWVRQELARHKEAKGIFLFMHITPAKWTPHGIDCPELRQLFSETTNLKGLFHGHDHDQDGLKRDAGKPYFFDGHYGGSWGTTYRGYRVIEIAENGTWTTYQFNASAEPKLNSFSGN